MYGFYRLPYLLRMRDLSLRGSGKPEGQTVKVTMNVEALVLPETKFVQEIVPADPDAAESEGGGRLRGRATLASFAGIYQKNILAPYKEPPKPKPKPPPRQDTKPKTTPQPRPEPPKPRQDPERGNTTVVALLTYRDEANGELVEEVVTRNDRRKNEQRIKIGEELDGLELAMVHWLGAVVEDDASKKYYVYQLGEKLSQRAELTKQSHPEIYQALKLDGK
jgi:hypothetical protein